MQQGWIKLHRKIQDHWLYQEKRVFSRYEAWIDLIMMANHKQTKILLGNELVEVQAGQAITSELKLMKKWGWGKTKLRTFLGILESEGMITKKADRKKTTITICNYCIYHEDEKENKPQANHEQTMSKPSADTDKNVKNDKNVKKKDKRYSRKQVYDDSSVYYKLAIYFYEQIKNNNPNHKKPNLQNWADDISKMIELDKRTEKQVKYLMQWVQQDEFEMVNVMSPAKLRKRFDNLIMKVKREKQQLPANVTPIDDKKRKYNYGF